MLAEIFMLKLEAAARVAAQQAAAWPRAQLRISLALLMLAVSPVASNQFGEALAQCICHGCGCKGGPGWRDNSTRQCVSHKQLFQICGRPPSEEKCHYEGASQVCPSNRLSDQPSEPR
jgi:hypothetical protein